MLFGKRGDKILDKIKTKMMPFINGPIYVGYLKTFCTRMKQIVQVWHKIQRVIKSSDLQSDETIAEFEANTDNL